MVMFYTKSVEEKIFALNVSNHIGRYTYLIMLFSVDRD